jgi:DNA primase
VSERLRYSVVRKTRVEKFPIAPILESLGQHVPPGSKRGRVKVKCVFHDDAVASATIDFDNNRFRCFACDESGDAVELIMRHEGVKFATALERCEDITGSQKSTVRKEPGSSSSLFDDTGYS